MPKFTFWARLNLPSPLLPSTAAIHCSALHHSWLSGTTGGGNGDRTGETWGEGLLVSNSALPWFPSQIVASSWAWLQLPQPFMALTPRRQPSLSSN